MPKRKRTRGKKRDGRKRRRPTRRRRRYPLGVMRAPSGAPSQNIVKMRYCSYIQLSSSISNYIPSYFFRATSCYDPDVPVGGQQPMGFDEMSQYYTFYTVLGSKITCSWAATTTGSGQDLVVGCNLDSDAVVPYSDWRGMVEAKKGTNRLITHQRNSVRTVSKFSAKKWFQLKDVKDNTDRIGAAVSTNPAINAFFGIWMNPLDLASDHTVNVKVVIDYIVMFSKPKQLSRS